MEGLIHWFSRNHVAANFIMGGILLMGITTWFKLKSEIFPETATDIATIMVPYPNAGPEEIEKSICIPIEEAVQGVDGIDRLKSTATENRGLIIVETATGYDVRDVMDDLKSQVDAIDSFPENAEEPVISEVLIKAQVPYDPDFLPGMYARVLVPAGQARRLLIPAERIVRLGQLQLVWVHIDGRAHRRFIRTGVTVPPGQVEVLSGLVAGDQLMQRGP